MRKVLTPVKQSWDEGMSNCIVDFIQNNGLYDCVQINKDNISDLISFLRGECRFDLYCKQCGEKRVFTMKPVDRHICAANGVTKINLGNELERIQNRPHFVNGPFVWNDEQTKPYLRIINICLSCAMDDSHKIDCTLMTKDNEIIKIGQYPSIADLSLFEIKEYEHVIDNESRRELGRAIGLYANGIGIGSFVYLRRVFERILLRAKEFAITDGADLTGFATMNVKDKISRLKDYLPEMVVSNPVIYSILSKGIHELSEEECLSYFPVLKECILLILYQWEEKRRAQASAKRLEASVSKISTNLS